MSDTFGALELPAQIPADAELDIAGDPGLLKIGGFCRAVLNRQLADAWHKIEPKSSQDPQTEEAAFVITVVTCNPGDDLPFNTRWLPALFLWRESSVPEHPADDYVVDRSEVHILWIGGPDVQVRRGQQDPILNAFNKALTDAFFQGRETTWIDPGDTDPTAAEFGSVLAERCGFHQLAYVTRAMRNDITVDMEQASARKYRGYKVLLDVSERRDQDLSARPGVAPSSVQVDITIDGLNVDESIDGV